MKISIRFLPIFLLAAVMVFAGPSPIEKAMNAAKEQGTLEKSVNYLKKIGVPVFLIGSFDFEKSLADVKISVQEGVVIFEDGGEYNLDQKIAFSVKDKSVYEAFDALSKESGILFVQVDANKVRGISNVTIDSLVQARSILEIATQIVKEGGVSYFTMSPLLFPGCGKFMGFSIYARN